MRYALIDNGIVTNIIWLYPANAADFPRAVPLADIPVAIGDSYTDSIFFRNGEQVLSPAEQAQKDVQDMADALALLGVDTAAEEVEP